MSDAEPRNLYVDANAFVEMFEKHSTTSALLRTLFVDIEPSVLRRHTSELTLPELLVKPMKDRNAELVDLYSGFVRTSELLEVVPVDRQILVAAAAIRAENGTIRLPDAIHIATAVEQNCEWFVTGDKRIRVLPQADKPLLILDPFSPNFTTFLGQLAT
jgi:predicted nucleic acid-binding protein